MMVMMVVIPVMVMVVMVPVAAPPMMVMMVPLHFLYLSRILRGRFIDGHQHGRRIRDGLEKIAIGLDFERFMGARRRGSRLGDLRCAESGGRAEEA